MKFFTLLLAFSLSFSVLASTTIFDADEGRHFIEVYEQDGSWIVEDYLVRPGLLQEKVLSRSFPLKTQARLFVEGLQQGRTQLDKSFKITTQERDAVAIWKVTQSWNLQWEEKYSQWVEQNLDKTFFTRNQLATDCADVAYALRWIFARNNGLPMGATLAGTQVVFTQDSGKAEWAQLPTHADWNKDQRFLRALNWLLNSVYTRTLWIDGYPLEISNKSIRPGVINLLGGHTEMIARLVNDGKTIPIQLLSSTVPRQVRELYGRAMTDGTPIAEDQGGLLQFRWLEKIQGTWVLREKTAMPLYSREQYQEKLCEGTDNFSMCIYQRLGMTFNPRTAVTAMVDSLSELARARVIVAREGLNFCAQNNCAPGTQGWEDHSTPTRDARLLAAYTSAIQVVSELSVLDSTLYDLWNKGLAGKALTDVHPDLSLATFLENLNLYLVSHDPRDPWDSRWASTPTAVATTVKNVFDRQAPLREALLAQAATCRQDRSLCSVGSNLFAKTHTLELDYNARSWLARYAHFCLNRPCPPAMLPSRWESTWFQSSLPWDSLDLRRGKNQTARKAQVFYGIKYIDEIGDAILFDQQKLVNRLSGAEIPVPAAAQLVYHAQQKHLLAINDQGLHLWNGSKFVLTPITGLAGLAYDTYPLGQHHLMIIPRTEETQELWVADLRDGSIRFKTIHAGLQAFNGAAIITLNDELGGKLLYEENGQFHELTVSNTQIPHRLWGQDNGKWIGSRTSYETSLTTVYAYSATQVEKLVDLPITYSNYRLGNIWLVQTESEAWALNKDTWLIEERYPKVWLSQSQVYDLEVFQFDSTTSGPVKDLLLHRNNLVTEFQIPLGHKLIATHSEWLGFEDEAKEFSVVDHQGREIIAPMKNQAPRSCRGRVDMALDCATINPQLSGWSYQQIEGDSTWVVTNFGSYGKLNTALAPWAQGLWFGKEGSSSVNLSTGAYTNLEGGSVFSPFSGVLIYFQK